MPTIGGWLAVAAVAFALFVGGCGAARFEVESLPPDIRRAYGIFEIRCSKCHALGRPLNARIDRMEHWRSYVARMRRMPGSGISAEDGVEILRFLEFYTYQIRGVPAPEAEEGGSEGGQSDG